MEFSLLYAIPRSGFLDSFFLVLTKVAGSYGQLWIYIGILLLLFKKTRRTGAAVLISYAAVYLVGQLFLKNLLSRPRPCQIDQTFALLVSPPPSFSFPSTHSGVSFAAAACIFLNHKNAGPAAYVLAALIAFSRLYLFLHFPTDILAGAVLGTLMGTLSVRFCGNVFKRFLPGQRE
jgi:undecaprenyl-diphosphatase